MRWILLSLLLFIAADVTLLYLIATHGGELALIGVIVFPWLFRGPLLDWARVVQQHAEKECGFHLIRGLGGHGYGRALHGPPFVSNVTPGANYRAEWPDAFVPFKPGLLLAVEPMISAGTGKTKSHGKEWPIFTADDSLAVHYEANILVTREGPRDLTEGMQNLPDVVG